jgi:hypothetical protein
MPVNLKGHLHRAARTFLIRGHHRYRIIKHFWPFIGGSNGTAVYGKKERRLGDIDF